MEPESKDNINRLVIIGNGFDLSLGMKTSYKDFLFEFLSGKLRGLYNLTESEKIKVVEEGDGYYRSEDELISLVIPISVNQNFILNLLETKQEFKELSSYLIKKGYLKFNFDLLTEIYYNLNINRWVDIETMYYDVLVNLIKDNKKYSSPQS